MLISSICALYIMLKLSVTRKGKKKNKKKKKKKKIPTPKTEVGKKQTNNQVLYTLNIS